MSLDTLFTEAAEAGGPPRFTEDDIERRVGVRRRRRRGLLTGGAALVVVGLAAGGAILAARGGSGADDVPATTVAEIPAVDASRGALMGEWEVVVPPEGISSVYEPASVIFGADGRFQFHVCNSGDGAWTVVEGVLVLGVEGREDRACGEQGAWSMRVDEALDTGVPTLYEDGLLRIVGQDVTFDLVRADDPTPADPGEPRVTADRPLPMTDEDLAGTWYVSSSPSSTLTFEEDGELRVDDCGAGTASWSTQDGTLSVRDLVTEDVDCGFGDRIRLDTAVLGQSTLTAQGLLVFQRSGGAAVLHRDPPLVDPAAVPLTAEQFLANAFGAMGVEACCAEPSHGSDVATSGFVHEGVPVSVVAGPVGQVDGFIPYTGVEAVLDSQATLSQADGRVIVGFACGDLVVALGPSTVDYPDDIAVIVDAAGRLIDALPCDAQPVGLP